MALIIAIVVPVVFVGIGALIIDVGTWYSARAMDQNAADAGVIAVAKTCYPGPCNAAAAASYADGSSNGKLAGQAYKVCGLATGLSSCSSLGVPEDGKACPKAPAGNAKYVDVQAAPKNADSSASLTSFFGYGKQKIGACAQAQFGPPGSCKQCVALTMSACEWLKDTANGTKFASVPSGGVYGTSAPQYTSPPSYFDTITARRGDADYDTTSGVASTNFYVANTIYDPRNPKAGYTSTPAAPSNAAIAGSETVLTPHGFGNTCNSGTPGWAAPGQFSWLSNSTCYVNITGSTYTGVGGNSSAPCEQAFTDSRANRTPIYIPIYTTVSGSTYTLEGFAAFVVTGWDVTSGNAGNWTVKKAPSLVAQADTGLPGGTTANYCGKTYTGSSSDVCIYGYFTQALVTAGQLQGGGSGASLGLTIPYLTG
jgi:hypothetical protein